MPRRIQMTRQRPWRKDHPDAVIVARPTRWGNEFGVWRALGRPAPLWHAETTRDGEPPKVVENCATAAAARGIATEAYRRVVLSGTRWWGIPTLEEVRAELRGRDLACWCPLDQPCHADVLLELANGGGHRERAAGGAVVKGEVLRELRVRIDGRERVVRVRRRIAPTGPRCPEWWHGWCQHPLGHAGPHKWGDR